MRSKLCLTEELFKVAWRYSLWRPALLLLDMAKDYRMYPDHVKHALAQLLDPAFDWAKMTAQVVELRRDHSSSSSFYVFRCDSICAHLEERARMEQAGLGHSLVMDLLSPSSGKLNPRLPWEELYRCYSATHSSGADSEMRRLWEGKQYWVALLRSLCRLLDDWIKCAHTSQEEMSRFVALQRKLLVVQDLDRHIASIESLPATGALHSADEVSAADISAVGTNLRALRSKLIKLTSR